MKRLLWPKAVLKLMSYILSILRYTYVTSWTPHIFFARYHWESYCEDEALKRDGESHWSGLSASDAVAVA